MRPTFKPWTTTTVHSKTRRARDEAVSLVKQRGAWRGHLSSRNMRMAKTPGVLNTANRPPAQDVVRFAVKETVLCNDYRV